MSAMSVMRRVVVSCAVLPPTRWSEEEGYARGDGGKFLHSCRPRRRHGRVGRRKRPGSVTRSVCVIMPARWAVLHHGQVADAAFEHEVEDVGAELVLGG